MTKTTAPHTTPSPNGGTTNASSPSSNPKRDFLFAATSMSWQLAVVVLVPIFGGYQLDKATDSLPVFTMLGFFIAMAGTGAVLWRQLQRFSPPPTKESHS